MAAAPAAISRASKTPPSAAHSLLKCSANASFWHSEGKRPVRGTSSECWVLLRLVCPQTCGSLWLSYSSLRLPPRCPRRQNLHRQRSPHRKRGPRPPRSLPPRDLPPPRLIAENLSLRATARS